jgi:hypothetical protein
MLCEQFLANALARDHPSHEIVLQPQGPRKKKFTLYSKCIEPICHHLNDDGIIPAINYKHVVSAPHGHCFLGHQWFASVLGTPPPEVSVTEGLLPRAHQCVLRQLRSQYCVHLKSYLHSIGKFDSPTCTECGSAPHTKSHLFDCLSFPRTWSSLIFGLAHVMQRISSPPFRPLPIFPSSLCLPSGLHRSPLPLAWFLRTDFPGNNNNNNNQEDKAQARKQLMIT